MDAEIFSGMVFNYNSRGCPLVKSAGKITAINGYTTARKTPIGDIAEYIITESRDRMNIAKIVNEIPSTTIGTVSAYSRTNGQSIMDCCGKIILIRGCIIPPEVGTDIEYRTLIRSKNFDIAWIVDKDDAVGKTVEFMTHRSDLLDFTSSREKDFFLETLKDIGQSYSQGHPEYALMNIENIYSIMYNRLKGKNKCGENRYDIVNGFKFIRTMIAEKYSII
jgi:hypothetical protein